MKKTINKFGKITKQDIWNAENIYHLKSDISRIGKLLYHYEIYKMIKNIPGDIVECGVFKGASLVRFLTFRAILENNFSRKILGFDIFGKFPLEKRKNDKNFILNFEKNTGNGISINELCDIFKEKKFDNFELIKGDVKVTIPKFLKRNPETKIALLHLDLDVYKPTKLALEKFIKHMSPRGIILIDDYSLAHGSTKAIDEFLKKNTKLKIQKLHYYKQPSFIVL
tara:strand:+ start:112 stop:786 length:675 start_codon:yes stop_codon:yes gene_type:complete